MAFGAFNHHRQKEAMADINVTPMVDVMLVLLVIFILSAPMFTNAVSLDLPKAKAAAVQQGTATVTVAIDAAGTVFWNDEALQGDELAQRLAAAAGRSPQPELQLRADRATRYEAVAQLMAAAQAQGLTKLVFVTDPKETQ
ncbi:ExbD/TolR family protein [Pseudoduganella chitinolytica]|uniref:Biopolymer transporter ExbD n=1 Tax=Pseudoduganella chitinolytica TaxID=34070 RepID=A0ABY8B988_9BURK|nr:biopolymer transporter ExbD [Pseudoduganella chitinolytica]WEF31623.1 biopolymer transporter ExbD [Pseudoduganella chitinolytica]